MPDELYPRFAATRMQAAMADTPVVLLNGPRQSGKTTLARMQADDARTYRTLDDETTLAAAMADPIGFIRDLGLATIDEIQRAPTLLRAIKKSVDDDRRPGRFLLTSTNVLALPQAADSLAGRMVIIDLLPLAQAEITKVQPGFLPSVFAGRPAAATAKAPLGNQLVRTVLTGGYPEMVRRHDPARRAERARNYIRAIVQRDVRDIATVDKLDQMPRLLRVLAQHAGQLANYTAIGNSLDMDAKTVRRYVGVLQQLFLIHSVKPWSTNQLKRLIKTPKLHFIDSGLLASLLGVTPAIAARSSVPSWKASSLQKSPSSPRPRRASSSSATTATRTRTRWTWSSKTRPATSSARSEGRRHGHRWRFHRAAQAGCGLQTPLSLRPGIARRRQGALLRGSHVRRAAVQPLGK